MRTPADSRYRAWLVEKEATHQAETSRAALGEQVRELREEAGWSIRQAADRADISWHTWNYIEQGHNVSWDMICRAAAALGMEAWVHLSTQ